MEAGVSQPRLDFTYLHAAFIIGAVFTYLVDQVSGKNSESNIKPYQYEYQCFEPYY